MASFDIFNIDTDPPTQYTQYDVPQASIVTQTFMGDTTTIVNNINGASGPNINLNGAAIGVAFTGSSGGNVTMSISNATTFRTAISAAKSGVNSDLNQFTALTGSGGWSIWTGTPDKTSHATYSGTASVGYVQAELQSVMDKLQQMTEAFKALQDTLLAGGEIKP